MKRSKLFCIALLFILCSCNTNEHKTNERSIKIEETKDYLYIKDTFTIPFTKDQEFYVTDSMDKIYSYVINIESDSAKETTDVLQSQAMSQIANIKKLDNGTIAMSTSLYGKAIESMNYITILIEKQPFIEGSESQINQVESYLFDKRTKQLITTNQLIEYLNLTNERITTAIQAKYTSEGNTICGTTPGDCYYEPKIYNDDSHFADTVLYLDENDNIVIYMQKSKGLSYELVPITLSKQELS